MKKLFSVIVAMVVACSLWAQDDVMQQAMEGYKNLTSLTAKVTKTVHNTMVTKDQVSTGTFYFKKPAMMCISTNGGKDKLLTDGASFTIVQNGKPATANGKGNSALGPLVDAIKGITSGNADTDLSDVADVDMERNGNLVVLTVTPIVKNAAERRKMMFQSFVITVDTKVGELRSVRLNEKGENYQLYTFSNFQKDVRIDDAVFSVK